MAGLPLAAVGIAWLASSLAFAVAMSATPGPNNAMLASSGSLWGFRRTIPHMLGVSIGFSSMLVAVAGGFGDLIFRHHELVSVMRWAATAYLLYLAWAIARATPRAEGLDSGREAARGRPLSFTRAALFQWINPKAWLIIVSASATLTATAGHPSFDRSLLLAIIFLATTLMSTALWTSFGVGAARILRTASALRRFNIAMAILLVVSVVLAIVGLG